MGLALHEGCVHVTARNGEQFSPGMVRECQAYDFAFSLFAPLPKAVPCLSRVNPLFETLRLSAVLLRLPLSQRQVVSHFVRASRYAVFDGQKNIQRAGVV